jgi:uncharacterized protein YdiU (UPF0061 family)
VSSPAATRPGLPVVDGPALTFDNVFTRTLPADPETRNARRTVLGAAYSWVSPTPTAAPKTMAYSREMADELGLGDFVERPGFAEVFSGNATLPGMQPWASCYGGHQFGHWAGQLGDGRAISLGEIITPAGTRAELQLKGAGPTPYSRTADGRAVLRSSIREFLCSEAMHHLGVPTTRALSLITTGDDVVRDMFYDGNAKPEPGAVVCRVAPTFLRFGNYQIFAARHDHDNLRALLDFTLATHFPHLGPPSPAAYAAWLREVSETTAKMIVHWMRVGFVHGVMNTDNMSILGLTIDYGPYGWVDDYDPDWTPNTTDASGRRYRFGHQPQVALWNLVQLAGAIEPAVGDIELLRPALRAYQETLDAGVQDMMAAKLGLQRFEPASDVDLVNDLLRLLPTVETDMTIFYRRLADVPTTGDLDDTALFAHLADAYYGDVPAAHREATVRWLRAYQARVRTDGTADAARRAAMNAINPKYVMRNYLAQEAIEAAEGGDPTMVHRLLDVMRRPYDEQPEHERWAGRRPDWARHKAGCSMLSCSS